MIDFPTNFSAIVVQFFSVIREYKRVIHPDECDRVVDVLMREESNHHGSVVVKFIDIRPKRLHIYPMNNRQNSLAYPLEMKSNCTEWIPSIQPNNSQQLPSWTLTNNELINISSNGNINASYNEPNIFMSLTESLFLELSNRAIAQGKLQRRVNVGRKNEGWRWEEYFILDMTRLWMFGISKVSMTERMESFPSFHQLYYVCCSLSAQAIDSSFLSFTICVTKLSELTGNASVLHTYEFKSKSQDETTYWINAITILNRIFADVMAQNLPSYVSSSFDISIAESISLNNVQSSNASIYCSDNDMIANIEYSISSIQSETSKLEFNQLKSFSKLEDVLKNRYLRGHFRKFLINNCVEENLLFWEYAEDYRRGHPLSTFPFTEAGLNSSHAITGAGNEQGSLVKWTEFIYNYFIEQDAPCQIFDSSGGGEESSKIKQIVDRNRAVPQDSSATLNAPLPPPTTFFALQMSTYSFMKSRHFVEFCFHPSFPKLLIASLHATERAKLGLNLMSSIIKSEAEPIISRGPAPPILPKIPDPASQNNNNNSNGPKFNLLSSIARTTLSFQTKPTLESKSFASAPSSSIASSNNKLNPNSSKNGFVATPWRHFGSFSSVISSNVSNSSNVRGNHKIASKVKATWLPDWWWEYQDLSWIEAAFSSKNNDDNAYITFPSPLISPFNSPSAENVFFRSYSNSAGNSNRSPLNNPSISEIDDNISLDPVANNNQEGIIDESLLAFSTGYMSKKSPFNHYFPNWMPSPFVMDRLIAILDQQQKAYHKQTHFQSLSTSARMDELSIHLDLLGRDFTSYNDYLRKNNLLEEQNNDNKAESQNNNEDLSVIDEQTNPSNDNNSTNSMNIFLRKAFIGYDFNNKFDSKSKFKQNEQSFHHSNPMSLIEPFLLASLECTKREAWLASHQLSSSMNNSKSVRIRSESQNSTSTTGDDNNRKSIPNSQIPFFPFQSDIESIKATVLQNARFSYYQPYSFIQNQPNSGIGRVVLAGTVRCRYFRRNNKPSNGQPPTQYFTAANGIVTLNQLEHINNSSQVVPNNHLSLFKSKVSTPVINNNNNYEMDLGNSSNSSVSMNMNTILSANQSNGLALRQPVDNQNQNSSNITPRNQILSMNNTSTNKYMSSMMSQQDSNEITMQLNSNSNNSNNNNSNNNTNNGNSNKNRSPSEDFTGLGAGVEWIRQLVLLHVFMGKTLLTLYDPNTSLPTAKIHLDTVTMVSPSNTELHSIDIYDSLGLNWQLIPEGIDEDDSKTISTRWIHAIGAFFPVNNSSSNPHSSNNNNSKNNTLGVGGNGISSSASVIHIVKTGYLLKRGQFNKAYKQRWFMLSSDGKLRYFKDDALISAYKGTIDLRKVDSVNNFVDWQAAVDAMGNASQWKDNTPKNAIAGILRLSKWLPGGNNEKNQNGNSMTNNNNNNNANNNVLNNNDSGPMNRKEIILKLGKGNQRIWTLQAEDEFETQQWISLLLQLMQHSKIMADAKSKNNNLNYNYYNYNHNSNNNSNDYYNNNKSKTLHENNNIIANDNNNKSNNNNVNVLIGDGDIIDDDDDDDED
eukprot:gene7771-10557_t